METVRQRLKPPNNKRGRTGPGAQQTTAQGDGGRRRIRRSQKGKGRARRGPPHRSLVSGHWGKIQLPLEKAVWESASSEHSHGARRRGGLENRLRGEGCCDPPGFKGSAEQLGKWSRFGDIQRVQGS